MTKVLASKFHVRLNDICTTFELLVRQSIWNFDPFLHLVVWFPKWRLSFCVKMNNVSRREMDGTLKQLPDHSYAE